MSVVFTGTTKECLYHYGQSLSSDRNEVSAARESLATYVGVGGRCVSDWFAGKKSPIGLNLLRVRIFLSRNGYVVTELGQLFEVVRDVAILIADDPDSFEHLRQKTAYTREAFMDVLNGRKNPGSERLKVLSDYLASRLLGREADNSRGDQSTELPKASDSALAINHEQVIRLVVGLMQALKPLTTLVLSDSFTPADREAIRDKAGEFTVFDLANNLNGLCGERALRAQKGRSR